MSVLDPIFYRTLFYDFCPVISPRILSYLGLFAHGVLYVSLR
jgi:hypothetical protein